MRLGLAVAGKFRVVQRDQIMDQWHEMAALAAHGGDLRGAFERTVGNQEEDLRAWALECLGQCAAAEGLGQAGATDGGVGRTAAMVPGMGYARDQFADEGGWQGGEADQRDLGDKGGAAIRHGSPPPRIGQLHPINPRGCAALCSAQQPGDVEEYVHYQSCLLYTSPSPRD